MVGTGLIDLENERVNSLLGENATKPRHVFIIGAKSIGMYGGYESFLDKLTLQHRDNPNIQYHIVTKANGDGYMDEKKLVATTMLDEHTFIYNNARITKIKVPQIGAAQAIIYDLKAFKYCLHYCAENRIKSPIFYILACRIGPFFRILVKKAHRIGGIVYVNPDGQEWMRAKWSKLVRKYWKKSEEQMARSADLLICDSINIEKYIKREYARFKPKTTYISYGADITRSNVQDGDERYTGWMQKHGIKEQEYYLCCGRLVPENSYETMIREFIASGTKRDLVMITTRNDDLQNQLEQKLQYSKDPRVKFVGSVYDSELLKKIRENAFAYLHGHTVGGTNPSLLESLGSTELNLLIDVCFNREVAEEAALYWNGSRGSLKELLNRVDEFSEEERRIYGNAAKKRVKSAYSWSFIGTEYEKLWQKT